VEEEEVKRVEDTKFSLSSSLLFDLLGSSTDVLTVLSSERFFSSAATWWEFSTVSGTLSDDDCMTRLSG
jgi:hypothetical protein